MFISYHIHQYLQISGSFSALYFKNTVVIKKAETFLGFRLNLIYLKQYIYSSIFPEFGTSLFRTLGKFQIELSS